MELAGTGIEVDKGNVLVIGTAFHHEAERIGNLVGVLAERMVTESAFGDPASGDYANALNERLVHADDSYVEVARRYVTELQGVARQCEASARDYGFTDDEISAAFPQGGGSR